MPPSSRPARPSPPPSRSRRAGAVAEPGRRGRVRLGPRGAAGGARRPARAPSGRAGLPAADRGRGPGRALHRRRVWGDTLERSRGWPARAGSGTPPVRTSPRSGPGGRGYPRSTPRCRAGSCRRDRPGAGRAALRLALGPRAGARDRGEAGLSSRSLVRRGGALRSRFTVATRFTFHQSPLLCVAVLRLWAAEGRQACREKEKA